MKKIVLLITLFSCSILGLVYADCPTFTDVSLNLSSDCTPGGTTTISVTFTPDFNGNSGTAIFAANGSILTDVNGDIVGVGSNQNDAQYDPNYVSDTPYTLTAVVNCDDVSGAFVGGFSSGNVQGSTCTDPDDQISVPVEMTSLEVLYKDDVVILRWKTASELNNTGFEVERSKDEQVWETLSFVKGYGTTVETQSYKWTDVTPYSGVNYYRLKQVDTDGDFEYSSIVTVNTGKKETDIKLFPTIAEQSIEVLTSFEEKDYSIEIYDMAGRKHKNIITNQSSTTIAIDDLYSGLHIIIIRYGNQSYFKRFVKV